MQKIAYLQRNRLKALNGRKVAGWIWILSRGIVLAGLCFLILFPVIVKLLNTFKDQVDLQDQTVLFIPKHWTLSNLKAVWDSISYPTTLLNSILFCFVMALLTTVSCTLVAYGFARYHFPGKKIFFALVILTLVIPPQAMLFPLYLKFKYFDILSFFKISGTLSGASLINTYLPFLLLSLTALSFKSGLFVYLLRQHFINVPSAIEEAASIDGCSDFGIFAKIMIPGAKPMLATVFLFSFVWTWTDAYFTSILFPEMPTLNMELFGMISSVTADSANFSLGLLRAPQFILLIFPLIILYVFTQRFFVQSIENSGIVG